MTEEQEQALFAPDEPLALKALLRKTPSRTKPDFSNTRMEAMFPESTAASSRTKRGTVKA